MVFSSPVFLFCFLPAVLVLYLLAGRHGRNLVLLNASLFFYAWGEKQLVLIMLGSILGNHALAVWVQATRGTGRARLALGISVVANIGLLAFYKYAGWLWDNATWLLSLLGLSPELLGSRPEIELPIGISFFTFQAWSAVIDVYRGEATVRKSPLDFGLYVSCFPQLIAGPIVRYRDVAEQIVERRVTLEGFAYGVRRFVAGLGKKVLIANVVAGPADAIFGLPAGELGLDVAWLGVVCYALQIYFDFSGYSDMAIGLGHMFGFRFLENFLHPYVARSVTEFWRRWHVSLSTWFRDYLYIPLGGNRRGPTRTYVNLVVVFFLCGLWHGASWTFVVWGLFHGLFLVLERAGLGTWLGRRPAWLRHAYLLLVVLVGWVFFRAEDFDHALGYLGAMFVPDALSNPLRAAALYLEPVTALALVAGVLGSIPWVDAVARWRERLRRQRRAFGVDLSLGVAMNSALAVVLVVSALELAAGSYNPFIYVRF